MGEEEERDRRSREEEGREREEDIKGKEEKGEKEEESNQRDKVFCLWDIWAYSP